MAFNKEIYELAKYAAQGKGYVANTETFSAKDVEVSLRDEIKKLIPDYYAFQRHKYDLYELIATTVDEIVPANVESFMGQFAEIQNLAQGQKAIFKKKLGRLRARNFIGRVSPAGIYETFRLDSTQFEVATHAVGGGVRVDFERYLDGAEDWSELIQLVMDALENEVYKEINYELQGSLNATGRPTANKVSGAYAKADMRDLVEAVRNYGAGAVIFATPNFVSTMGDDIAYATASTMNPNVSPQDIEDLRTTGYIGMFYGAPIVVIPNPYTDETNTTLQFDDDYAYVMPTNGDKVVKVAFEGGTLINDLGQLPGDYSMEMMVYKKFGTAILFTNTWGIYHITG